VLYPLIAILKTGATVAGRFGPLSEAGVVVSGVLVSWLVGAVYFGLPVAVTPNHRARSNKVARRLVRVFAPAFVGALLSLILLELANAPVVTMIPINSLLV